MAGGSVSQHLSSLNYSDTTMCSLPVLAASQEELEQQQRECIACVLDRLQQDPSRLTVFPRFQGKEVRTVRIEERGADRKEKRDDEKPMRNVEERSSSDDSSSSEEEDEDDQLPMATPDLIRHMQLLPGAPLLPNLSLRSSQRELASFMQLVALVTRRECGVPLGGCPTAQHARIHADDFRRDELCVAAVQETAMRSMRAASFTLERVRADGCKRQPASGKATDADAQTETAHLIVHLDHHSSLGCSARSSLTGPGQQRRCWCACWIVTAPNRLASPQPSTASLPCVSCTRLRSCKKENMDAVLVHLCLCIRSHDVPTRADAWMAMQQPCSATEPLRLALSLTLTSSVGNEDEGQ